MEFLAWIENTALSIWVREALWVFPTLLVLHALGMAFLVGNSLALNLRLLNLLPTFPVVYFKQFYGLAIIAFVVNLVSGLLLLLSYPAKGLTNPVFYLKMGIVLTAVLLLFRQFRQLKFDGQAQMSWALDKKIACLILVLWVVGIFSGRFLAYTHTWLLVT